MCAVFRRESALGYAIEAACQRRTATLRLPRRPRGLNRDYKRDLGRDGDAAGHVPYRDAGRYAHCFASRTAFAAGRHHLGHEGRGDRMPRSANRLFLHANLHHAHPAAHTSTAVSALTGATRSVRSTSSPIWRAGTRSSWPVRSTIRRIMASSPSSKAVARPSLRSRTAVRRCGRWPAARCSPAGDHRAAFSLLRIAGRIDALLDNGDIDAVFCFSSPMAEYVFRSRHAHGKLRRAAAADRSHRRRLVQMAAVSGRSPRAAALGVRLRSRAPRRLRTAHLARIRRAFPGE